MTHPADEPVLDPAVIEGLRALEEDGAPGLFSELVELFLSDTPPRIQEMEQAADSGDAKGVESAAHSLKSSSGNVGASALAALFREIEALGREDDLESVRGLVDRTRAAYEAVATALRSETA